MMRLHIIISCLELLQHLLPYQQGQNRTNFDLCTVYFWSRGHRGVLMGPGAPKWHFRQTNGNCTMTQLHNVISCLELLQHLLPYQQGQKRTNFDLCTVYIPLGLALKYFVYNLLALACAPAPATGNYFFLCPIISLAMVDTFKCYNRVDSIVSPHWPRR